MPMEEMLDYVDEHDRVLGQATRYEVHRRNLMHRSTHIMLINSNGEFFLQLRSMSKDNNPGLWDTSAAGHVDAGEGYLQCAVRELNEELGVKLDGSELLEIGRMSPSADNGFEFVRIYGARSDLPITLEPDEIDDGKWLQSATLEQWLARSPEDFAETFLVIWDTISEWRESTR